MTSMKRLFVAVAVAAPLVLAPAAAASASTSAPSVGSTTNLKGAGSRVKFVPTKVSGPAVKQSKCSDTDYSVAVFNTTTVAQQLTINGVDFGPPIAAGAEYPICGQGIGGVTLSLASSPKAHLSVSIS